MNGYEHMQMVENSELVLYYLIVYKEEYIPCSQVSVYNVWHVKVSHGIGDLNWEVEQESDGECWLQGLLFDVLCQWSQWGKFCDLWEIEE